LGAPSRNWPVKPLGRSKSRRAPDQGLPLAQPARSCLRQATEENVMPPVGKSSPVKPASEASIRTCNEE
jgi:hypothetical protein